MLKEKIEILGKKANRQELCLLIKEENAIAIFKKLVEVNLNKITLIEVINNGDWCISLHINELDYEKLFDELRRFEIYSIEEDTFGKTFKKRLGVY